MPHIGLQELTLLLLLALVPLWIAYMLGKKVGYGKALRDMAEGKFPTISGSNKEQG